MKKIKVYFTMEDLIKSGVIPKDSLLKDVKIEDDDSVTITLYTNSDELYELDLDLVRNHINIFH